MVHRREQDCVRTHRGGASIRRILVPPRILGTCEAIAQSTGSDLFQHSYPIHHDRWHGETSRLLYLQDQLLARKDLAAWAYYEAGIELELYRTEAGFRFSWHYPDGDERPTWMRSQDLDRQPVPELFLENWAEVLLP